MKASPHPPPSCYAAAHPALSESHTIVCRRRYPALPQALATPHPSTSRAILSYGLGECASHVRTDRPHPAPEGAGLARKALRPPVASLPSKGFHTPAPVRGAFVLPATHDRGFAPRRASAAWQAPHQRSYRAPLEPIDQGASPLEPDKGLSHPSTTRRRLPRPGTHGQSLRALDDAQAAFMPLHPDEGERPRPRRIRPAERRCA